MNCLWSEAWIDMNYIWISMKRLMNCVLLTVNQYEPIWTSMLHNFSSHETVWTGMNQTEFTWFSIDCMAIPTLETLLPLPLPQGTRATLNLITIRWWRDCTISFNRSGCLIQRDGWLAAMFQTASLGESLAELLERLANPFVDSIILELRVVGQQLLHNFQLRDSCQITILIT